MSLPLGLGPLPIGRNALFALAQRLSGKRLDPYPAFNFLVEIDGLLTGGFSRVEGLEGSIEYEDYHQGGSMDTRQFPKGVSYPPLVLSHGVTDLSALWSWFDSAKRGSFHRKTVSIMLLDARQLPAMWWYCLDALPKKWAGPTFNAGNDSEVAIERIELVHRGIKRGALSPLLGLARALW